MVTLELISSLKIENYLILLEVYILNTITYDKFAIR